MTFDQLPCTLTESYRSRPSRYRDMTYNRCGASGLSLPAISLGLWQNFGDEGDFEQATQMIGRAFDLGITHFDLANNYGRPPGSAETCFGRILKENFKGYRDEMIISTKAGYDMWPGPYGAGGSRKYLIASCDQSLKRLGLDYVDIFYSHRFDPDTPLEETMGALAHLVHQGKALYVGISTYSSCQTLEAVSMLKKWRIPCLVHQASYSLLNRWVEADLLDVLGEKGVGCVAFSTLAQGLLSEKYRAGIPPHSRAGRKGTSFAPDMVTCEMKDTLAALGKMAKRRGQTLAQMALAWVLKDSRITSALVGASTPEQVEENVNALNCLSFTDEELTDIDRWVGHQRIHRWVPRKTGA